MTVQRLTWFPSSSAISALRLVALTPLLLPLAHTCSGTVLMVHRWLSRGYRAATELLKTSGSVKVKVSMEANNIY